VPLNHHGGLWQCEGVLRKIKREVTTMMSIVPDYDLSIAENELPCELYKDMFI
jgi:hypothetical protein